MLAPNAEVSMFRWKEPKERIPLAIRQIRSLCGRIGPLLLKRRTSQPRCEAVDAKIQAHIVIIER